jgi:hypothetical protein
MRLKYDPAEQFIVNAALRTLATPTCAVSMGSKYSVLKLNSFWLDECKARISESVTPSKEFCSAVFVFTSARAIECRPINAKCFARSIWTTAGSKRSWGICSKSSNRSLYSGSRIRITAWPFRRNGMNRPATKA